MAPAMDRPLLFTRTFCLTCVSTFCFFASFYLLLAVLPLYVLAHGGDEAEIGLIIGVFALSAMCWRPVSGRIMDRQGRRAVLLTGAAIFLLSSILYHAARSVPALLLLRLFHGVGMGTFSTAATAIVSDVSPLPRRGEAMGVFGLAANLAMAVGPALGVSITRAWGFTALFLVSAAVAAAAILLPLPVPETLPHPSAPAAPGRFSPSAYFSRRALLPAAITFTLCVTYGCLMSFLPLYASRKGIGNVGAFFTVFALALAAVRTPAGGLSDRYGRLAVTGPGMIAVAAAVTAIGFTGSLLPLLGLAALYGAGFGTVHPALLALTADRARPEERGRGMATMLTAWELGISLGSVLMGLLQASSFTAMFLAAGAVAGLGALLCLRPAPLPAPSP